MLPISCLEKQVVTRSTSIDQWVHRVYESLRWKFSFTFSIKAETDGKFCWSSFFTYLRPARYANPFSEIWTSSIRVTDCKVSRATLNRAIEPWWKKVSRKFRLNQSWTFTIGNKLTFFEMNFLQRFQTVFNKRKTIRISFVEMSNFVFILNELRWAKPWEFIQASTARISSIWKWPSAPDGIAL